MHTDYAKVVRLVVYSSMITLVHSVIFCTSKVRGEMGTGLSHFDGLAGMGVWLRLIKIMLLVSYYSSSRLSLPSLLMWYDEGRFHVFQAFSVVCFYLI